MRTEVRSLFFRVVARLILGLCVGLSAAHATPVLVTVNTTGLAGTVATLAFDLIDGGAPPNTVTISGFSTDGTLGAAFPAIGGASGSLATSVSLGDSSFFNEFAQGLTLNTIFSFVFDTTDLAPGGITPDSFTFFLLDAAGALPLVTTSDPTGSDALLLYNIGSPLGLSAYTSNQVTVTTGPVPGGNVPEPATVMLVLVALLVLGLIAQWRRHPGAGEPLPRGAAARRLSARAGAVLTALSGLLCFAAAPTWAADVSDRVTVTQSGFVFNRATGTFDTMATLRNISASAVEAPVTLEVASVSAPSVTLANAAGNNAGLPFVNVSGPLAPGQQTTALLKFNNPQRVAFSFTTRVFGSLPVAAGLPEVIAAPKQFFINTPTQVRFQAQVPPAVGLDKSSVKLYRAGASGGPTGNPLCSLLDNGVLANGDDIATDNVYSCFVTFNPASPETIRIVVSANISGNAALSPVVALDAVSPLDPAVAQQILDSQTQAQALAQAAIAAQGDTLAARQTAVAQILNLPGVQSAGVASDDTTIWIRYLSGIDGGLMLNPPGTRGGPARADERGTLQVRPYIPASKAADSVAPPSFPHFRPLGGSVVRRSVKSLLSPPAAPEPNTIANTNVLIWDAYNDQFAPADEGPGLKTLFEGSQCPLFSVTYLKDAQATVASVRTFSNYGTIIMVTHGAVDANGQVVFLTHESSTVLSMLANGIDLALGRIMIIGAGAAGQVFAVRPSLINTLGAMPDSVVYNGSCQSSANATMSNAFVGKGAKTYYGFTRVVNSAFAQSVATQLFTPMVNSFKTTGDAFTPVTPKVDPVAPFATFTQTGDTNLAYSGDLQNASFEKGNLSSWTAAGDGRTVLGLGPFVPTDGSYAGLISTGLGFTTASGSIEQKFCLPATATQLTFDWNFSSEEFIEYCNSQFDDRFQVVLQTPTGSTTLFQTSVNALCTPLAVVPTALAFDQSGPGCVPTPANVGFGTGGNDCKVWSTGWKSQTIDISGIAATNMGKGVTLRFQSTDVGDSIFDSAILLDKIVIVRP